MRVLALDAISSATDDGPYLSSLEDTDRAVDDSPLRYRVDPCVLRTI